MPYKNYEENSNFGSPASFSAWGSKQIARKHFAGCEYVRIVNRAGFFCQTNFLHGSFHCKGLRFVQAVVFGPCLRIVSRRITSDSC